MNAKRNLILLKEINRTKDIRSCQYNQITKKWDIEFNDGKYCSYNYCNVEWIKNPIVLNPNLYRIETTRELFNIEAIYVFQSKNECYWHICFANGSEHTYKKNELKILRHLENI